MKTKATKNTQPSLKEVLLTSRPFSWPNTAIPFFVGYTIGHGAITLSCIIGTIYFCFFYNYLMYGVNDIYDYDSDIKNPRKNSIEGGLVDKAKHKMMFYLIIGLNLPLLVFLLATGSVLSNIVIGLIVFFAFSYSMSPLRFKEVPILDSINSSLHFVLPLVFGLVYAGAGSLPWPAIIAFFCWGAASQALGSIPDIKPDRSAGIASIATKLGSKFTNTYSLVLYSLCCLIATIFYFPWGLLASLILLVYPLNVLFFRKFRSDANSTQYRRAWKNFIWLNLIVGFWLSQLLLFVFDPFGLAGIRTVWFAGFILGFGIVQLALITYNYHVLARPKSKRLGELPHIDILVHSIGDKDNIASTILALIGQNYPHFDIYYANLDNNPQAQKIAEGYQDKRLHIVDVPKPPAGWAMQAWASNVLFKKSKSSIAVLLGADIILLPNTLSVIASIFDASAIELVSLLPADQNKSFWQQLIMSQEQYLLFGMYPSAYLTQKHPELATAYSSLLAFKRSSINSVGGFESVKNSPLEDLDIANRAKRAGLNTAFYCASDLAISQNRSDFGELRNYNEQRLYPSLRFNMPLSITLITGGIFVTTLPIVILTYLLAIGQYEGTILLTVGFVLMLFNRLIVMFKSKQSITGALLYPLGSLLILLEIISSMIKYELKSPRWKSRYEV